MGAGSSSVCILTASGKLFCLGSSEIVNAMNETGNISIVTDKLLPLYAGVETLNPNLTYSTNEALYTEVSDFAIASTSLCVTLKMDESLRCTYNILDSENSRSNQSPLSSITKMKLSEDEK